MRPRHVVDRPTHKDLKQAMELLKKRGVQGPYAAYVTKEQRERLGPRSGEVEIRTGLGEPAKRGAG
jgi:hypothetical protein